jgi:hypothetical protein
MPQKKTLSGRTGSGRVASPSGRTAEKRGVTQILVYSVFLIANTAQAERVSEKSPRRNSEQREEFL